MDLVSADPSDLVLVVIVSEIVESVKKVCVGGTCHRAHIDYYRSNDSRMDATYFNRRRVYDEVCPCVCSNVCWFVSFCW